VWLFGGLVGVAVVSRVAVCCSVLQATSRLSDVYLLRSSDF